MAEVLGVNVVLASSGYMKRCADEKLQAQGRKDVASV